MQVKDFSILYAFVNALQDVAHTGKADYEVDLDLPTHRLSGYEVDDGNKKIILKSEKIKENK